MTLKQCYELFGGDYEGVVSRLVKEERIKKFLFKFLTDSTFTGLTEFIADGNYEEAFRAAHTIKGLCQNLGFDQLYKSSFALTEALRGGKKPEDDTLYQQVKEDYEQVINAIKSLDAE